jgi:beta-galactosidase
LNEGWRFHPGFDSRFVEPGYDDSGWEPVSLPHPGIELPRHYFDERRSCRICCYRTKIFEKCHADIESFLRFEGVSSRSEVWANGKLVCTHDGAYTPFEARLPRQPEIVVTVVVDSTENPLFPPFGGSIDYLCYAGIYRSVSLHHCHEIRLAKVRTSFPEPGRLFVDATVSGEGDIGFQATVSDGEATLGRIEGTVQDGRISATIENLDLVPWSPENPRLYVFSLVLGSVDRYDCRIGMRTVRFEPDGFYLNGEKRLLVGLNRHQSYPYVGYAMPASMQRFDARRLKRLGVDIVRTSHYPQDPAFLDACDELGLLVLEEIPGWQHVSEDPAWRESCLENVRSMIERDINHPCIVSWGVRINESADDDRLYRQTNALARQLDPGRQTCGVRNFAKSHLLEDVYTYNDFSHDGTNAGLAPKKKICRKQVPYLVTEFNGHMFPAKRYDPPSVRAEHALRHLRVLDSLYGSKGIAGAIGWCMNDYNTHSNFGSGDEVCYHGVCDQFRVPKLAAYAYRAQRDAEPFLVCASTMDGGDFPAAWIGEVLVLTNCDRVDLYHNEEFVGSYLPDTRRFPHLPHPPVIIDDLIGSRIDSVQCLVPRDRRRLRALLLKVGRQGARFTLADKLSMAYLMRRGRLSYDDAVDLYKRFVGNWGDAGSVWRFEGMAGDRKVCEETYGESRDAVLVLEPTATALKPGPSYDVAQITVLVKKQGMTMPLPYAHEPFSVSVQGPLSLLSPALSATEGGVGAIYVRNTAGSGEGTVTVHSNLGDKQVAFTVG